jgi:hypothetical protein
VELNTIGYQLSIQVDLNLLRPVNHKILIAWFSGSWFKYFLLLWSSLCDLSAAKPFKRLSLSLRWIGIRIIFFLKNV